MGKIFGIAAGLVLLITAVAAVAQTTTGSQQASTPESPFKVLYSFNDKIKDPMWPARLGLMAEGRDGSLYTTAPGGGAHGKGAIFKITPKGAMTVLFSFNGPDGATPWSGLRVAKDGNFYGTTNGGGKYQAGTIFELTPAGGLVTLYDFRNGAVIPRPVGRQPTAQELLDAAGSYPISGPVQGADGSFYGIVPTGNIQRDGVLYSLSPQGAFHGMHNFHEEGINYPCALIMGDDGYLYGTALGGPKGNQFGCVFRASTDGNITILHTFDGKNGSQPFNLIQGRDHNLYGTAALGGQPLSGHARGLIYRVSLGGEFTVLHALTGYDGAGPIAGVEEGKDGLLYGDTSWGGPLAGGIPGLVYRLRSDGSDYTIVHLFQGFDGSAAQTPLVLHSNGKLYGTTYGGGDHTVGVVFSLDPSVVQVDEVRLGIPKLQTSGRDRTLVQSVYGLGTGRGQVSGQWLVDNKSAQTLSPTDVDFTAGKWVRLGTFKKVMIGHHQLLFAVDGRKAPRTSLEDVAVTGFIPSLDGWPFENSSLKTAPGVLLLKYTGLKDLNSAVKLTDDGVCAGFAVSARDYFYEPTMQPTRPPDHHDTIAIDKLLIQDEIDENAAPKVQINWPAAVGYSAPPSVAAYQQVLPQAAAMIQAQIQAGKPSVIDIFSFRPDPNGSISGHTVVGTASFSSTNILGMTAGGGETEIQNMSLFSIYDPNFPKNDNEYLGSFDNGVDPVGIQFLTSDGSIAAFPEGYSVLKLWLPNTFHNH